MQSNPEQAIEEIRHRCQSKALQMRCPQHQKNARVMVEGNNFGHVTFEVFTCCEQFRAQVCEELTDELYLRNTLGPTGYHGIDDFAL